MYLIDMTVCILVYTLSACLRRLCETCIH